MQQYIDRTLNICRTLNQNAKISTRFFRIESKYRRKHHRDSVWNTTTLVVALVNLWTTVGFFPSVVFPWLLRSSVHTSAYIRRPRDTRRRGIMRERESIERQTGESRRELDIARSGLLLLRMKDSHVAAITLSAMSFSLLMRKTFLDRVTQICSKRDLHFLREKTTRQFNLTISLKKCTYRMIMSRSVTPRW